MALHERGVIARGTRPIHGETSQVSHDKRGTLFLQVPSTFVAMRYHSLVVEDAGPSFDVVATTAAREIMAIQHRTRPWFGLQFHPESFLSEYGADIVDAFLSAPSDIAQTSAPTHVGEVFRL